MKISTNQATLIGCISPIFWGLSVLLVRTLSETLGVGKGLAINYLIALVFVFLLFGVPNLKAMPLKYYICGLGCAIGTSMTFAFSLGLAKDGTQTMEVGMINYLWPTLTILFAVLFNGQKAKWWVGIGMLLAIYGIFVVLSGNLLIDFRAMWSHITSNPISYFLALWAAIFWAAYSNFTRAWAKGQNPTTLIFALDAIFFNAIWLLDLAPSYPWNTKGVLFAVGSALIMGAAYGMWTFGVQKGRIEIMSIMSYFTPVLSCIFASFLIGAKLTHEFWVGVSIVVLGSFICWAATREKHRSPN